MSGAELSQEDWRRFHELLTAPGTGLDDLVRPGDDFKPGCNDEVLARVGEGDEVPTIISRFWSTSALDALRTYVDPHNWPDLSPFWQSMTPTAPITPRLNGWEGRFREVVLLPTGPITAHLDVSYTETENAVAIQYLEVAGQADSVDIDRGWVMATVDTVAPNGLPSLVLATKSIRFTDAFLNQFTGLACDNGWVDLMIKMAHAAGPVGGGSPFPKDPPVTTGDADELARWAEQARTVLDQNVDATRATVAALRQGRLDAAVVDELFGIGERLIGLGSQSARTWRQLLRDLASGR